ncbi:MAG: PKD domain-containing protein [Bacteroidota bacterium]|jgi:PKD repeat protein|nr:PKD domain-containing protein [Prolixibacteraceae bacterium]MDI9564769.1 PKD domain-containing protein [Bacteroidota bacterium]NLS99062.1 PKD domain-containing protein [Bacteroidales bacterium]OQB80908.1 MAG: Microbial collagenase precursor [Bacteroidetes bacterium ADurb.Bin123]HNZ69219.1 PKD domain-containing protein [Prolixibacteraceae bacterium]
MKRIKIFALCTGFLAAALIWSCEQEITPEMFPPAAVDFSYSAKSLHYVVGEEIRFLNLSSTGSSWQWDFGDGTTSTEKDPVHKYAEPGTYTVALKADGTTEVKKKLMISDIVPVVKFTSSDPVVIYNQSQVQFSVMLENPESKPVVLNWQFPSGTRGPDVDDLGKSKSEAPSVVFGSIGSQIVSLTVNIGGKDLDPVMVNVRVNYNSPATTLYYAVKGGNIMAKKLIEGIDPAVNNAFDMGYRSGKHPLTLQFSGDWLYVFDAGTFFTYVAEPLYRTAGDGEIFVVSHDGSRRESVVENFGGDTFLDFYYGFIDAEQQMIYWADRREGIFKTPVNTRNKKFSLAEFPYWIRNNWLGYYGEGIGWGNINGTIMRYNGLWWWAKNSTGSGIFRFADSDNLNRAKVDGDPVPSAGAIHQSFGIRSFVIDDLNKKLYFSDSRYKMIMRSNLDGTGIKIIDRSPFDGEGGDSEALHVTGMAVDDKYLYWAYRGPQPPAGADPETYYAANPLHRSGIKRISLTEETPVVEYFISGVEAYGIAIDPTPR